MEAKFYDMYSVPTQIPASKARQQIVEEVQTYLLHLNLLAYPSSVDTDHFVRYTTQIDGIYSNITMGALMV